MLSVANLSAHSGQRMLVEGISFDVKPGQMLCIIGESGAGKTTVLKALQGMIPARCDRFRFAPARIDVTGMLPTRAGLPLTRWVMQDPLAALNPRLRLGTSIAESLHSLRLPVREQRLRVQDALAAVELAPEFADRFPAQVSLGQAQRACLARALIAQPKLIFFDEPLSALDAAVQKKIARRMDALRRTSGTTYIVVTHDLGFAATFADHIVLMRGGRMEACQTRVAFFATPASPYAAQLIEAARQLGGLGETEPA